MEYPLISEYREAILSAEDNFNELASLRPVLDSHGNPVMSSGNFAVVFKMRDENDGKLYAVKCFTRDQANRNEAYTAISSFLSNTYRGKYLISVKFHENELFVDSSQTSESEFPVVVMDWVDGYGLEEYIENNITDDSKLNTLYENFRNLVEDLLTSNFAHGDLKPDNILVQPDGSIVLVDYDGMFVPVLKGMQSSETGTPQFQYSKRKPTDFNEYIDDYAGIYITLMIKLITIEHKPMSFYLSMRREAFVSYSSKFLNDVYVSKLLSAYLMVNSVGYIEREMLAHVFFDELKRNRELELRLVSEALSGDSTAMFQLGNTYKRGIFTPVNEHKALQWHYLARLLGNPNSSCDICRYCYHLFNQDDSIQSKMCENNVDFALCRTGEFSQIKNPEYALECIEKASALNFAPAIQWLYVSSRLGRHNDISLIQRAAELNYTESILKLSELYSKGELVSKDLEKSYMYLQKAAELGDSKAQYQIGLMYYKGSPSIPKDLSKAIIWFSRSAEQGNTDAVYRLSLCYLVGKGVERNIDMAFSLLIRFHDCSNENILRLLGFCYENGIGVKPNYLQAYTYYRAAVYTLGGCSWAEHNLENLCYVQNLSDEINVSDEEFENSIFINDRKYSKDGRRFLSVWNGYKDLNIENGCEVLCNYSINDLYSECDCYYVYKITLPESLMRIGNNVFCASIEIIENKSLNFEVKNDFLLSYDRQTLYRYFGKNQVVTIPSSIKYIKGGAFSDKAINEIVIHKGVLFMGSNPFVGTGYFNDNNNKFEKVKLRIDNNRFCMCNDTLYSTEDRRLISYLGDDFSLKIKEDTKIIGENAFFNAHLETIYLPKTVESIHESAFYYCVNSLEQIAVPKGMTRKYYAILPKYVLKKVIITEY